MPVKSKLKQRQKQYRDLEKLRSQGLYAGRIDKRRKVSKYQTNILQKFGDVVKGAARVLSGVFRPSTYKGIYKTVRDKVIVPKVKGETARVNKEGRIAVTRRGPRGEKIKARTTELPLSHPPPEIAPNEMFAVPFVRKHKTGRGKVTYSYFWMRFTDRADMERFMSQYEPDRYGDWLRWAFIETIVPGKSREERDRELDEAREKQAIAWRDLGFRVPTAESVGRANRSRHKRARNRGHGVND